MKTKTQIESWALDVVTARTKDNKPRPEDSLVEFKAEWPTDANKAARQIAGICNSARGDDVLWIIGFDEQNGAVGCVSADIQTWWPSIESEFNEIHPFMIDVVFHLGGKSLVALLFETDRAPYLVRNPQFGSVQGVVVQYDVPFRNNARTNTACRSQLVSILGPKIQKPEIENIGVHGELRDYRTISNPLFICLHAYITPQSERLVFPFHRCKAELIADSGEIYTELDLKFVPGNHRTSYSDEHIVQSPHELIIKYPCMMLFQIRDKKMKGAIPNWLKTEAYDVSVELKAIEYDFAIEIKSRMVPRPELVQDARSSNRSEVTQMWRS